MGVGSKTELLVHTDRAKAAGVQVIRRFTGGGTVVVDAQSLFASFIGNFVRDFVGTSPDFLYIFSGKSLCLFKTGGHRREEGPAGADAVV